MADRIRAEVEGATVELVDGGRGDFIVTADGREVWNKKATGLGFPDEEDIVADLLG